ncbi:ester cyclase [Phenylobacterium immobile]|uniref:ester cyclase n=1 Tax=Phenylobacterium immobile TaxID=21 RepID=UPI000A7B367E|nr:ester cyclase [Phenylobacterium immobile]
MKSLENLRLSALIAGLAALAIAGPVLAQTPASDAAALARYKAAEAIGEAHLKTFDTLDFDVFSNQKWERLKESHAANVAVHWPDGHVTTGIDRHIADLKAMFVYAPDTRIKQHPVRLAQGEWTSVTGVMEGTFTAPMPTPDGPIAPTGKTFKLPMATVSHWTNGTMDEEYLFWDNQTYMTQLGLGK